MRQRCKVIGLVLLIFSLIGAGCFQQEVPALSDKQVNNLEKETNPPETFSPPEEIRPISYKLAFTGDIMIHDGQIKAAWQPGNKQYSFAGYFEEVEEYLKTADVTVGNLETTLSGAERGYSGYPQFNAPETLAKELADAGFDVMTTANNHSYDRREAGVLSTISYLQEQGLAYTGTFPTREAASSPLLIDKRGLKTAFLAYTYGTNGLLVPEEKSFLVNRIDPAKIRNDIEKSRQAGAELVVVNLHFGVEYQRFPGKKETNLVKEVAEAGADLIIGTHPHVLQRIDYVDTQYLGRPKRVLVAYSLGNFVSGYRSRYKDTGIILTVDITKGPEGVTVKGYRYLPVWVHRYQSQGKTLYRVIPVERGIARYKDKNKGFDYHITTADYHKLQQAFEDTVSLLGIQNLITE